MTVQDANKKTATQGQVNELRKKLHAAGRTAPEVEELIHGIQDAYGYFPVVQLEEELAKLEEE